MYTCTHPHTHAHLRVYVLYCRKYRSFSVCCCVFSQVNLTQCRTTKTILADVNMCKGYTKLVGMKHPGKGAAIDIPVSRFASFLLAVQ